jgi:hypothetical protein
MEEPVPRSLAKVIAIEKSVKSDASRRITDLYKDIQKPQLFMGLSRSYQPRAEDGDQLPPESVLVQKRAEDALRGAGEALAGLFDVTLAKDVANTHARASVVVDGTTLLADVPATYLLFLEKQLTDLHTFVAHLPLLDPADRWSLNGDTFQTVPVMTVRTRKEPTPYIMYPHTDKHPAQVERVDVDKPVGDWTLIRYSGAVEASRQRELLARVTALRLAVREAREEANKVEADSPEVGATVFAWLFR